MRTRYRCVRQQSAEDCAAASLATVTEYYGRRTSINRVREAIATASGGTTFASLRRGAEALGFLAKCVQAGPNVLDAIERMPLPALIYWKGYHVLVLYGRRGGHFVVADPALGIRYLSREELRKGWEGRLTLLLRPHPVRFWLRPTETGSPWRHMWRRLRPHRAQWACVLALSAGAALIGLGLPIVLGTQLDTMMAARASGHAVTFALALAGVQAAHSAGLWLRWLAADRLSLALSNGLRAEFGAQLLELPLSFHETRSGAMVRHRLDEIVRVSSLVVALMADLPLQVATVAAGALILAARHPGTLGLVSLAALVMLAGLAVVIRRMRQAGYRLSASLGETLMLFSQYFSSAVTIRTLGAASHLERELTDRLAGEGERNLLDTRLLRTGWAVNHAAAGLAAAGILWLAAAGFAGGATTVGQAVVAAGVALAVLKAVASVASYTLDVAETRAATRFLEECFDISRERHSDGTHPPVRLSATDDLACEGLAFRHQERPWLFEGLAARFPGGQVSALVGPSGCGKTTLARLLAGLYLPAAGTVTLGDHRLTDLPRDCVRGQVTLVPEEPKFLTRSVAENLRLGAPEAAMAAVEAACRAAAADDFVKALPQGYDTILGDFSARLSAGEQQRLSIARALLAEPAVLILDESTSHLDLETETRVLDGVLRRRAGRTTILISHRPHVVERAACVVRLGQAACVSRWDMPAASAGTPATMAR